MPPPRSFMSGVDWVCRNLEEAARRIENPVRGEMERPSDPGRKFDVILKTGDPAFATRLRSLASVLREEAGNLHE